eukprot:1140941-Pelagomonas_calceolata.AAC.9
MHGGNLAHSTRLDKRLPVPVEIRRFERQQLLLLMALLWFYKKDVSAPTLIRCCSETGICRPICVLCMKARPGQQK